MMPISDKDRMIINGVDLTHIKMEFIQRLPEKLEELHKLIEQRNVDAITNFGHKLKGSGASYGMNELSEIGKHIEDLKLNVSWEYMQELYHQFVELVKRLTEE